MRVKFPPMVRRHREATLPAPGEGGHVNARPKIHYWGTPQAEKATHVGEEKVRRVLQHHIHKEAGE